MTLHADLIDEIEVLLMFNPQSTLTGIKIHHEARQGLIAAGERLAQKGLITQVDGGYLTPLGQQVTGHLDPAIAILKSAC